MKFATSTALLASTSTALKLSAHPNLLATSTTQGAGVAVESTYHCDTDCRAGTGAPTEGRYAYFSCADAFAAAGHEMETNSLHTILVNDQEQMEVILWTQAMTWQASDMTQDCALRKHPKGDAVEGDFAVGDTFKFVSPDGVQVKSTYHCDGDCRNGEGEPTEGRYAYFDCAVAEYWAGTELETNSFHTVIVNGWEEYEIILWTKAETWQASDQENDCAARLHPKDSAQEGQWAVGDTFVFKPKVDILSWDDWYAYFDCAQAESVKGSAITKWSTAIVESEGEELEVIAFTEASGQALDCAGEYGCHALNWDTNTGDCAYRPKHWGSFNPADVMNMNFEHIDSFIYA